MKEKKEKYADSKGLNFDDFKLILFKISHKTD